MTNEEWLDKKFDELLEKTREHSKVISIICFLVDCGLMALSIWVHWLFIFPMTVSMFITYGIVKMAVENWLDSDHKE